MREERSDDQPPAVEGRVAPDERLRTADVFASLLVASGVEMVFGLPGGAISPMHDALLDHPSVRVVTTRHEAGALFAAAGYARATGRMCVVLVTSGPGILNAMTGLASAFYDHLPIVVLVGEVPRSRFGKGAMQEGSPYEIDIPRMTSSITKMSAECNEANSAAAYLSRAIAVAKSGKPGPVLLTLPIDVATAVVTRPQIALAGHVEPPLSSELTHRAVALLEEAKRPALFIGSGARGGAAPSLVRALAERLQIPVMSSPKGKGIFPDDHPLNLGVFGLGSHPSTNDYLEPGIDVLLVVGSSLGEAATSGWSPALKPSRKLIQIDIDARQLGRNYSVDIGLVGDSAVVLGELVEQVTAAEREPRTFGIRRFDDSLLQGEQGRIAPQRAIWELQQVMPANTLYSLDIGEHMLFGIHHLRIREPNSFVLSLGFGSMGSGLGAALGMKLGRPERPVAAICGDGCFSMALGDVATAVREHVPFVVAVMNDERYGMVEIGHQALYGRTPSFSAGTMDISKLANGVGAQSVVIERPGDLLAIDLPRMLQRGPVVLDIRIDTTVHMPKNARFEFLKKQTATKSPVLRLVN